MAETFSLVNYCFFLPRSIDDEQGLGTSGFIGMIVGIIGISDGYESDIVFNSRIRFNGLVQKVAYKSGHVLERFSLTYAPCML